MTTNIQAISDVLTRHGINALMGLVGNGNLDFIADMVDRCGVRYVGFRHENGAVAAADGYARAGSRLGVATVTHGPGLTNALTALVTARRARSPLLLITGNASGYTHRSTQRLNHRAVAEALDVPVVSPGPQDDWAQAAEFALDQAARGAVLLDLPAEATRGHARLSSTPQPRRSHTASEPDPDDLQQAIALLEGAERVLIVAGRGAVRAGVRDALIRLGRRYGAKLGTSLAAKGFFSRENGDIGIVGGLASPSSWEACRTCDVALVVGAGLNGFTTEHGTLLQSAEVVRLDEDPEAAATVDVHLRLSGHLPSILNALLAEGRQEARTGWEPEAAFDRRTQPVSWPDPVLQRLDQALPEERTVTFDHGNLANRAVPFLRVFDPAQSLFMPDFGSLGLALPAAIGAALARPERRTVAIVGDGGLMMSLPELDTLKRSGASVLVVALNDGVYGAEYPHFAELGASLSPATFASESIAEIARAMGVRGEVMEEGDDLARLDLLAAHDHEPVVLEVRCAPPTEASH
jgi:thiamine pyrophosphate-dependent acetolactate synthase large subunit-like protein